MLLYFIKRLLMLIPVLFFVSVLVFLIMRVFSPDPATIVLGQHASLEKAEAWREQMGLNEPIITQYLNYMNTVNVFGDIGITDYKWTIVLAMGMNATNIILLRNTFEGVPQEIEEAARIDGATEMQILTKVYIPMSKATIATVALFFGISRWNGYFWAYKVTQEGGQSYSWPIQVLIRDIIENETDITGKYNADNDHLFETQGQAVSVLYSFIILSIIPILIIYPFIQKYFAKGVNMGGVKE